MASSPPAPRPGPSRAGRGPERSPADPIARREVLDPSLAAAVAAWLDHDPDPATRAELEALRDAGDAAALAERFAGRLAFGTAGLRAELGAGPMRMNRLVVRQAAAGLVRHLQDLGAATPLVAIGFDARHGSRAFAADSAGVVAAAGGRAVVFAGPGPTPLLAFAVRHLGADAGVMVTASHNPPADNGYKVYLADGAQIVPPTDERIAARIAEAGLDVAVAPFDHPAIRTMDAGVEDAYLEVVVGQLRRPGARSVSVAYTAMHGVGAATLRRAFARAGFPAPHVVGAQAEPDPDFPTVAFPNPEEPGALDLGLALAGEVGADVLLANDPDADRLGVAIPIGPGADGAVPGPPDGAVPGPPDGAVPGPPDGDGPAWRALTGNEIGVLLADHVLRHGRPADGGADRLVVTTVVSSRLLAALAAHHGVRYAETLTGFKWIVRPGLDDPSSRFVFGYEEALGYSVGPTVRDKDGIGAALVFAELVADLRAQGLGVADRLDELARTFGVHATAGWSKRFASRAGGAAEAAAAMAALRAQPPATVAGEPVVTVDDLAARAGVAASDTLIWTLPAGRIVFRPSGTEPKLKVYLEVVEPVGERAVAVASQAAGARLAALRADLDARLAG